MSRGLPGFERFPVWNEPEKFARVIAQGCWPLHPLATWFLTRQSDVVQSRSALTVVKEAIERIGAEPAISGSGLRQVSAAELLLRHLLPEMLAAERGSGAAVAETLQILLEKFQSHLTADQRLVLAGVAILEKMRVGKQTQTAMDELLCEATALDAAAVQGAARALGQELGAIEWNADLGQYELIADATTRGQFQQWLRQRQSALSPEAVRDLFVRNAAKDGDLVDIPTDFGHLHDIATTEWFFEARWASVQTVENVIKTAVQEWERAILPKEAKGRVIYLYLQADDDLAAVDATIERCLREETRRVGSGGPSGVGDRPRGRRGRGRRASGADPHFYRTACRRGAGTLSPLRARRARAQPSGAEGGAGGDDSGAPVLDRRVRGDSGRTPEKRRGGDLCAGLSQGHRPFPSMASRPRRAAVPPTRRKSRAA